MPEPASDGSIPAVIDPGDPERRQTAFEMLLRSPRFEEHRRRVRAEVEHWPPRKDTPPGGPPPGWVIQERSPSEEDAFRREISAYVIERTIYFSWLYYRAFLSGGNAAVRRGRAAIITTAENATKLAAELATAMRQLWQSDNPAVRQILGPLADHYSRGDGLPVAFGDPGFVATLEEMRRRVELIATALPADPGGRRRSVVFEELALRLAAIYHGITGEQAPISARAGAPEGRFFRFAAAVLTWLRAAANECPDVTLDLPPSDDALRMALRRLEQVNTTSAPK
jgi:hypothetical protein